MRDISAYFCCGKTKLKMDTAIKTEVSRMAGLSQLVVEGYMAINDQVS